MPFAIDNVKLGGPAQLGESSHTCGYVTGAAEGGVYGAGDAEGDGRVTLFGRVA